jgi:hypothetical protein
VREGHLAGVGDGPAGLRFMDAAEADHNYRPKLFS